MEKQKQKLYKKIFKIENLELKKKKYIYLVRE